MVTVEVEPTGDKELFKTASQNSFYVRNKHYASGILNDPEFKSPYTVTSVNDNGGKITKQVEGSPELEFTVKFTADSVRFSIDEIARRDGKTPAKQRYNLVDEWALQEVEHCKPELVTNERSASYKFGDNEMLVEYDPLRIIVKRNGQDQLVFNGQQLMNFEHYRDPGDGDSCLGPYESNIGMWQDEYKQHRDVKKHGPESVAMDIEFVGYKHVHGIPEHSTGISLKDSKEYNDEPYRLFNLDAFEYEIDSPKALYGSIPLMQAHRPDGFSTGLFWVNASDTYVSLSKNEQKKSCNSHWISEAGLLDFVVFLGDSPADISKGYGQLTGFAQLPQEFSLGYHQCRWNYFTQDELLGINSGFDDQDIPYDAIWLDIEYTENKKYFTWDKKQFPNVRQMCDELDGDHRKLITIIDPHVKYGTENYHVYDTLSAKGKNGHLVKDGEGKDIRGHCWPGESVWLDVFDPKGHEAWSGFHKKENYCEGAPNVHIWNDMNEPSCFNAPENTMDKAAVHYGGWEHRNLHNLYGVAFVKSTYDGLLERYKETDERPFILTRSFYAGSQRYGAAWTGDNFSSWSHLRASLPMIMTAGISGMPQIGADTAGFFQEPSPELMTRWFQAGAFYPFFRGHAHIETDPREPWTRGDPYTSLIRDAIKLRYRLLPVFYTAFYHASVMGTPVMKPMFYDFATNEETYAMDDQFFVGNSGILVKPVLEEGLDSVDLYLPDGEVYYDYIAGGKVSYQGQGYHKISMPLEKLPIFARGGHIHARKDVERKSAGAMSNDPYTLVVVVSKAGTAQGELYVDDGKSHAYKRGNYALCQFEYSGGVLTSRVEGSPERDISGVKINAIQIIGGASLPISGSVTVSQGGESWSVKLTDEGISGLGVRVCEGWELRF